MKEKIIYFSIMLLCISWITSCQAKTTKDPLSTTKPTTSPLLRKIPTQPFVTAVPDLITEQSDQTSDVFVFPGGVFQLSVPEGWNLDVSEDGSVFISEPGGEGAIYITVTNTGYAFGSQAFDQFLSAREVNFFAGFPGYEEMNREINENHNYGFIEKKVIFNEIPEIVDTYYFAEDQAVFVIDFWMESEKEQDYKTMYQPMIESFQKDPALVKDFIIYNFIYEFRDTTDEFSFEVPISWLYQTISEEGSVIDYFYAPDNQAYLQHIIFYADNNSDQNTIFEKIYQANKSIFSGDFDENLIEYEQEQENGGRYLKWDTTNENWQFETVYFFDDGKVFALSGLIQKDYLEIYQTTIDYGFDWYAVPAAQ